MDRIKITPIYYTSKKKTNMILILDNYVLLDLFQFIKPKDIINISLLCNEHHSKISYISHLITINEYIINSYKTLIYFDKIKFNVKSLIINMKSYNDIKLITNDILNYIFTKCKLNFIKTLKLDRCCCLTKNAFNYLSTVTNMNKLERVDLSFCYSITDKEIKILSKFKTIKILDLNSCFEITNKSIKYISNLINLTFLDIQYCEKINIKAIKLLYKFKKLLLMWGKKKIIYIQNLLKRY